MRSTIILFIVAALDTTSSTWAADAACPRQMMPSPIASTKLAPPRPLNNAITFSATPHYDSGGRSWVVRLLQPYDALPAKLNVVQLKQRIDCNVYDVENQWEAELTAPEYIALATRLAPLAIPTPEQFMPQKRATSRVGRTGLIVSMQTQGWEVSRQLNFHDTNGETISSIIRDVVTRKTPQATLPISADWSSPR